MPEAPILHEVRAELDALDDALHRMLMQRAEVVDRLRSSGAKPAGTTLRPGREAAILRRLLAAHRGPMPPAALVRIWREILAASVSQQGSPGVALPQDAALARLAAEHFGGATPLRQHSGWASALQSVAAGDAGIAVLPWPRDSDHAEEEWWPRLDAQHLQVIARLPFLSEREPPLEAAVLALYPADESGEDAVLFRVEAEEDATRGAIAARHPAARVLATRREAGFTHALLEAAAAPAGATVLGRYALPLRGIRKP
jgi:chorismate mutase